MNLSLAAIAEALAERYRVLRTIDCCGKSFARRVAMFSADEAEASDTLCVCPSERLADAIETPGKCSFVFFGEPPAAPHPGNGAIVVEDEASPYDVIALIARLFETVNSWELSVANMLLEGQSLQDVFSLTQKLLNNSIYLHDAQFNVLAFAEGSTGASVLETYEFLKRGKMVPDEIEQLSNEPGYIDTLESRGVQFKEKTLIPPDLYNYLYCNIRYKDRHEGRLIVDEVARPFTKVDILVVDRLAHFIETFYQGRLGAQGAHAEGLIVALSALLSGEDVDANAIEAQLHDLGWGLGIPLACLVVGFDSQKRDLQLGATAAGLIEDVYDNSIAFQFEKRLVALVSLKQGEPEVRRTHIESTLINGLGLEVGASLSFSRLFELKEHYNQALFALRFGPGPTNQMHCFEDCVLDYVIAALSESCSFQTVCPEGLRRLVEHDEFNHTNYVATLRAFLENNCSPSKSCKALFLHRSTFQYRLDKIQALTECDFDDPQTRLLYHLAFHLLDRL